MILFGSRESKWDRKRRGMFRSVFTTHKGKKVFAMMLADLGLFEPTEQGNEAQVALRNYAIKLMEDVGTFHENNLEEITDVLLRVSPYTPRDEEVENRAGE